MICNVDVYLKQLQDFKVSYKSFKNKYSSKCVPLKSDTSLEERGTRLNSTIRIQNMSYNYNSKTGINGVCIKRLRRQRKTLHNAANCRIFKCKEFVLLIEQKSGKMK